MNYNNSHFNTLLVKPVNNLINIIIESVHFTEEMSNIPLKITLQEFLITSKIIIHGIAIMELLKVIHLEKTLRMD